MRYSFSRINTLMLVRVMGWLLMIEALFMAGPLAVALLYHENDVNAWLFSIAITLGTGVLTALCVRPRRFDMGKREGFLLTAMVWVVFSAFGMLPFIISDLHLSVTDAFFEAMSGFTTTGATVCDVSSLHITHSIHFWRSLMQWIGGMGIILFTLAVLPMLNSSGGMQMFNAEVTGITHEKLRPRVSSTAKRLWLVYTLLTGLLFVLYVIGPMPVFDSLCHALTTISTGGFSTRPEAIGAWDALYVKIVTTIFMFIGGVNFALIFKISTGRIKAAWQNEIFRFYLWIILVVFIIFDGTLLLNRLVEPTWEHLTIDPLFHIISMMSSTGYMMTEAADWGAAIGIISMILMFFGACAGSTSGGAKIDRALIFWKNGRNELYRCIYPNHILSVSNNGRTMSPELVLKVGVFLGLYILVIVVGSVLLSLTGVSAADSFITSFTCVSNVGDCVPSVGVSPVESYMLIPSAGKWILSMLMLTGRLEIFTILVLLTRAFWRK